MKNNRTLCGQLMVRKGECELLDNAIAREVKWKEYAMELAQAVIEFHKIGIKVDDWPQDYRVLNYADRAIELAKKGVYEDGKKTKRRKK